MGIEWVETKDGINSMVSWVVTFKISYIIAHYFFGAVHGRYLRNSVVVWK